MVLPVLLGAAAVVVVALVRVGAASWPDAAGPLALLVAATVAEAFPVPIEGVKAGSTSLATIPIVAAAVVYGWEWAAVVGLLTMCLVELRRRKPVLQCAYNSALYALGGAAAGAVSDLISPRYELALLGAAAFYLVDISLLAAVIARVNDGRYWIVATEFFSSTFIPFVVMAATTAILVRVWQQSPYLALLMAPPLIAIARYQRKLHAAMVRQRELDRLKDEFIAVVSHELRTPLAAVYGGVETLQRRSLSVDAQRRVFGVIRQEATRLAKLVDDVLWASRLDGRRDSPNPTRFDPASLAHEAVAAVAEMAPARVRLLVLPDEGVPPVLADRERAQRVLVNLLENAVKYSPDGGTIEARANVAGDYVRFSVCDEGIGVPEAERERIFDKFTRLDPQMSRGIGGTGLGLYIARQLVEQMHGRIWTEANHPRGSRFVFELPSSTSV